MLLTVDELISTIYSLGRSQGSYSRLSQEIHECLEIDEEGYRNGLEELIIENELKTALDLVLYIEC